ncbi:uncharacterized protein LOC117649656 [Thrips palmi]|uniref:Uncharacterized protein LOC117649656 n=1 Tax=Thrips palmi TaxID=161013 RepID=A0A6P8ZU38_THRPL|nr:uncharacterized protein LOC117649656 [Thrips palmi]
MLRFCPLFFPQEMSFDIAEDMAKAELKYQEPALAGEAYENQEAAALKSEPTEPPLEMTSEVIDDMKFIKVEEQTHNEQINCLWSRPRRRNGGTNLSIAKVKAIASEYANTSNAFSHRWFTALYPRGPIISCPGCPLPVEFGPSAFLTLLQHVASCHEEHSKEMYTVIINKYFSFIQYMKNIVRNKTKEKYVKKLRSHTQSQ